MYKNFNQKPKALVTDIPRNVNTVDLELKHVKLYECDLGLGAKKDTLSVINYFLSPVGLDSLTTLLLDIVKTFSAAETGKYADPDSLLAWVKYQVINQINLKYQDLYGHGSIGLNEFKENKDNRLGHALGKNRSQKNPPGWKYGNLLASGTSDPNDPALLQSFEIRPEDLAFEFAQGFEEIHGIDRAYFLESIAEDRRKAELFPGLFTTHDTTLQPIELKKWVGGRYYYVYLDKIKVEQYPDEGTYVGTAKLDVYLLMDVPTLDQKIVLKANDLNFTPNGPLVTPIKLELNNDIAIRMNNATRVFLEKSPDTYVAVDCDGFAGMGLKGKIEICRKYLTPLNPETLEVLPEPKRVSGSFTLQLNHWNDFYTTISIDPFAITGYEDYKWTFNTIVFDFSDEKSPTGFPPLGYVSPFASSAGFTNLWQGIYIENITVTLPKMFNKNNQNTSVGVERVLFDERGFSGSAVVTTPILSLGEGSAGGWGLSVDNFRLTFLANQLAYGGFGGKINVPIIRGGQCNPSGALTPDDCFDYLAMILPANKYQISVVIPPNVHYCADLWKAGTVIINPNSSINLSVQNGEFKADATLHGSVVLNVNIGNFEMSLPDTIAFENLKVYNREPYFNVGTWKMPSSINCGIGGFGISVGDLGMAKGTSAGEFFLNFGLGISLTKEGGSEDSLGISAKANFRILGKLTTPGNIQSWVYDKVQLTAISVDASFSAATIKGELAFYNDSVSGWGKGFRGVLKTKFKGINTQIDALAQFGRSTGNGGTFKYFFVDAMVVLGTGIQFFPPLELRGFGGGVFRHMTRDTSETPLPNNETASPGLPPNLGVSLSGIHYIPDQTAGLGFKATVVICIPKENAFNANLSLEVLFNSGGSLRAINLDGIAFFMDNIKLGLPPKFKASNTAALKAEAHIGAQFTPEFKLHGTLDAYLNVGNVLTGVGPNGHMIDAEFHIEPGYWYINIGTPEHPCGVKLKLGGASLATMQTYIDIGKNIPPMPPLPAAVQSMTGMGSFMQQESARATGRGFAFGANISIGDGQKKCLPACDAPFYYYANILATAGFDLMIQDYGDAQCSNTNEPIGINGWYASGQAYALLQSGVGVGVKVFGIQKEVEVLSVGGAAALQMKLPNPFWARGAVGGYFSVLGGLVKGNVDFQFTVGESCQIVGGNNSENDLAVIAYLSPVDGSDQVDVAAHPSATFNIPIGQNYVVNDAISNQSVTFKAELDYARIKYKGYVMPSDVVWQEDKLFLEVIPRFMFPRYDTVTFEVKVNIFKNNQPLEPEIKTVSFISGDDYEGIPDFNVKASYPQDGQYNFYSAEWSEQKGYILLNANQPDLFAINSTSGRVVARVTAASGQSFETQAKYDINQKKIEFGLPSGQFQSQMLYKLELVKMQSGPTYASSGGNASKASAAGSVTENPTELILYDTYFRTSLYTKFSDKVTALAAQNIPPVNSLTGTFRLPVNIEPFDRYETGGVANSDGMITATALLSQTNWYRDSIKPVMYDLYAGSTPGSNGIWIDERLPETYGRIPYKAVFIETTSGGNDLCVTSEQFKSGLANTFNANQSVHYFVPAVVSQDWGDLCIDVNYYVRALCALEDDCPCCISWGCCAYMAGSYGCLSTCNNYANPILYANYYIQQRLPTQALRNMFLYKNLSAPIAGTYPVSMSYQLPGTNTVTSIRTLNIVK
jgi:hypothetical protein